MPNKNVMVVEKWKERKNTCEERKSVISEKKEDERGGDGAKRLSGCEAGVQTSKQDYLL